MVEPLQPPLIEELKKAHPGLTDEDIQHYEELLSKRFSLDPDKEADVVKKLDKLREQLVAEKMPNLIAVCSAYNKLQQRDKPP